MKKFNNTSNNSISVVPYDSNWPNIFCAEAERLKIALGNNCIAIHHIGSTAVPKLAAKNKIDIIAEVEELDFDFQKLNSLGYKYRGGFNLPLRRSFTLRSSNLDVNLHIFEKNDPEVELNLNFRDHLRTNSKDREQYQALKYELSERETKSIKLNEIYNSYTLGKHNLINKIIAKTKFNKLRITFAAHYLEWEIVNKYRKQYQDKKSLQLPEIDKAGLIHKHLILYKGISNIGYSEVQLLDNGIAKINITEIDSSEESNYQEKYNYFISSIKKWLSLEKYKEIQINHS